MSRFNSKPSAAYRAAVRALKAIPVGERDSAFAESIVEEMAQRADKQLGARKNKRQWQNVFGIDPHDEQELPANDHGELREGASLTYSSHPYDLTLADMRKIVELCDTHGVNVRVDARSWYFPGGTLRMTYRKRKTK